MNVYKVHDADMWLYALLSSRDPHVNISHKKMPTWRAHCRFVRSKPYAAWYLVYAGQQPAGAVYLTRANEIGIHLGKNFQGAGIGSRAVRMLMQRHPRNRYLANINPANAVSIQFFERLGFEQLQVTYAYEPD